MFVSKMPMNSIIGIRVSDNAGIINSREIFYPFFSPHLCLPVKPGEHVWIIYEKVNDRNLGYWVSRKCVDFQVDDLNFTHADRVSLYKRKATEPGRALGLGGSARQVRVPTFPNGDPDSRMLRTIRDTGGYARITKSASSFGGSQGQNEFIGEPVPRITKRVGDVVFQGSNNTSIVLGTDFFPTGVRNLKSFGTSMSDPGQGAIDICAGRGQTNSTAAAFDTAGVVNTRGYAETPKYPKRDMHQGVENPSEGSPDPANDLSRIYLSMRSNGDNNFSLIYPSIVDGEDEGVAQVSESPYAIMKSNEIRLVGRGSGSVRIVKEGTADEDRAVIMMLEDGTIMVDGPKIIIGSGIEGSSGEGEQVIIGRGATEPIVLGNELKDLLDTFFGDLSSHLTTIFNTHIHPTAVGPTGPPVALATSMIAACSTAQSDLINILSKVGKTK
jgi:hypothetical protein